MLRKVRDAFRIQQALANRGLKVTPLEAYDSWVRYSLSNAETWIDIRKQEKDETIYRKVRKHIQNLDESTELLKVKDKVELKLSSAVKDLDSIGKQEIQKVLSYKNMVLNFQYFIKEPLKN